LHREVIMPAVQRAANDGLLNITEEQVAPTEKGFLFLNNLLGYF
jgi:coproporphyrinogen III oxidase-like Fe-S oxidoreductase